MKLDKTWYYGYQVSVFKTWYLFYKKLPKCIQNYPRSKILVATNINMQAKLVNLDFWSQDISFIFGVAMKKHVNGWSCQKLPIVDTHEHVQELRTNSIRASLPLNCLHPFAQYGPTCFAIRHGLVSTWWLVRTSFSSKLKANLRLFLESPHIHLTNRINHVVFLSFLSPTCMVPPSSLSFGHQSQYCTKSNHMHAPVPSLFFDQTNRDYYEHLQSDLTNLALYMPARASADNARQPVIWDAAHPHTSNVDPQTHAIYSRRSYDTNNLNSIVQKNMIKQNKIIFNISDMPNEIKVRMGRITRRWPDNSPDAIHAACLVDILASCSAYFACILPHTPLLP